MASLQLGRLYPITDSRNRRGWSHVQMARTLLEAGIRFFQVREKELPDALLYGQLLQVARLCQDFGAQFVVNDRIDLALAVEADGVHLGQEDLPVEAARRVLGPNRLLGLSTHNPSQFEAATRLAVDYIAVGPIFPTTSKETSDTPLGPTILTQLCAASPCPVVAIGGITLATAAPIWRAGAASVAVISDLLDSADPSQRIQQYLELAGSLPGNNL